MRRFLVLGLLALACSRPAPRDDFTLKIAVAGPLAPLAHDTHGTAAVYAQDLVFEPVFRPEGMGFASRAFARWERTTAKGLRALVAEGLKFSDGSPVEIEDVVRSLEAGGLAARAEGRWLDVEPGRDALPVDASLLMTTLFKTTSAGDLGTGAYRLLSQSEKRIVVERVVAAQGRIRYVEFVSFPTVREALARALKGEVNAVEDLDDRQAELLEGIPSLRVVRTRGPHALAVVMNARMLDPALRRSMSEALPLDEIGELSQGKACAPSPSPHRLAPLPAGDVLDISAVSTDASIDRAVLALRRGLGPRGGQIARLRTDDPRDLLTRHPLAVFNTLVWPPAAGALYWKTNGPVNTNGYSNPAYDAAVDAGDFERAEAELKKDPPALLLCRRERIAAVDSRLKNATLGSWGLLDTLPDWEVSP